MPDLPFSEIKPHPQRSDPIEIYPPQQQPGDGASVEVAIHFTSNRPDPSVSVFVALITNKNALPINDLALRFGVDKVGTEAER